MAKVRPRSAVDIARTANENPPNCKVSLGPNLAINAEKPARVPTTSARAPIDINNFPVSILERTKIEPTRIPIAMAKLFIASDITVILFGLSLSASASNTSPRPSNGDVRLSRTFISFHNVRNDPAVIPIANTDPQSIFLKTFIIVLATLIRVSFTLLKPD